MKILLVLMVIIPLSNSCSRAVECAVEGCHQGGNQILSAGEGADNSEDATIDRDGPQDSKIEAIEQRLDVLADMDETVEGRQKNRRTEIILTPKLDELLRIIEMN